MTPKTPNTLHGAEQIMPGAATLRRRVLSVPTLSAVAIGGSLLVFALVRIFDLDWSEVWSNIRSVDPIKYLLAIVLYYLSFWFRGLRWRLIATTANIGGRNGAGIPRMQGNQSCRQRQKNSRKRPREAIIAHEAWQQGAES